MFYKNVKIILIFVLLFLQISFSNTDIDEKDDSVSVENEELENDDITDESNFNNKKSPHTEKLFSPEDLFSGSLEVAKGVAQLISITFSSRSASTKRKDSVPVENIIKIFLKLLGFGKSKLGAVTINAIIFLAQLIGSSLLDKQDIPDINEIRAPKGNLYSWIFQNIPNHVKDLVNASQQHTLPEDVIASIREDSSVQTDCIQLLMCKLAPIVWSMQKTLTSSPSNIKEKWPRMTPLQRLYFSLPNMDEVIDHSSTCEMRFPSCRLRYRDIILD